MLVSTNNQYFRLGFEALIRQQGQSINGKIIIFDVGERLYFLRETDEHEYYPSDLYRILTEGLCFEKKELDTPEAFSLLLSGRIDRVKSPYKKSSEELTRCEILVLEALCKGLSTLEVADLLNKSIKTVSAQKSRALRKLGMRNIQMFHRTIVQWHILTKEFKSGFTRREILYGLHNGF
ncbi:response regulator transcription factor [Salmonella enterica]